MAQIQTKIDRNHLTIIIKKMDKLTKLNVETASGIDHIEETQEGLLKGGFGILIAPDSNDLVDPLDFNIRQCKCNTGNCVAGCGGVATTTQESSGGGVTLGLRF